MHITREFFSLRKKDINMKSTVKCSEASAKKGPLSNLLWVLGPSQLSGGESEGLMIQITEALGSRQLLSRSERLEGVGKGAWLGVSRWLGGGPAGGSLLLETCCLKEGASGLSYRLPQRWGWCGTLKGCKGSASPAS